MGKMKWQPAEDPQKKESLAKKSKREIEPTAAAPVRGFIRFIVICFAMAAAALVVVAAVARPAMPGSQEPAVMIVTTTPDFYATTAADNQALATAAAADMVSVNESVQAMATKTADESQAIATAQAEQIAAVSVNVANVGESLQAMATAQAEQLSNMATTQAAELGMVATRAATNEAQIERTAENVTTLRKDIVNGILWAVGVLLSFALGAAVMSLRRPLQLFPYPNVPHVIVHEPQPTPLPAQNNIADGFFAGVRSGQDVSRLAGIVRQHWPEFPDLPRPGGKSELWRRSWPRFSRSEDPPPHLGGNWYSMLNEAIEHVYTVSSSSSSLR